MLQMRELMLDPLAGSYQAARKHIGFLHAAFDAALHRALHAAAQDLRAPQ